MAKNPTEVAGGGHVLIQMLHHSLIPSVTHIIWLTQQHSVMDLKTEHANLSISMTAEPLENVNICLDDLHENVHVSPNPFYTLVE